LTAPRVEFGSFIQNRTMRIEFAVCRTQKSHSDFMGTRAQIPMGRNADNLLYRGNETDAPSELNAFLLDGKFS
jgi:hypothetical protein